MSKLRYLVICSIALAIGLLSCTEEPAIVAVTSVTLDSTSITLVEGDSQTLIATVSPSNAENQKVLWSSSNSSVASVKEGVVTALKVGTATITAKTDDGGKTATCDVTVKANFIPVTGISLDKTSYEMIEGDEVTLFATVNPDNATNKNVTWSSSDPSVATVSNGKVTALKVGQTTISVTTDDGGKVASCEVIVKFIPVEGVTLDKTKCEVTEGEEIRLTASVQPDKATNKDVIWTSSDNSVASVVDGVISAHIPGNVTIDVKTVEGNFSASCEVSVKERDWIDLSSNESANCYIITSKGAYSFAAVVGNSSTTINNICSVDVLWESFGTNETPSSGDLISSAAYRNGKILIMTPDVYKKGNAVVAAKDANGVILWSWHIWLTDQPNEEVYKNDAGVMMDRNLGALSAQKGSDLSLGLLYQYGRKDPFPSSSSKNKAIVAKTTGEWPTPAIDIPILESDKGVIGETTQFQIENPMTFIRFRNGGKTKGSVWTTEKSVSDPCPGGWKIPDDVWAKAIGYSGRIEDSGLWDDDNCGINGSELFGATAWYPAGSTLDADDGELKFYLTMAGRNGFYWGVNTIFQFFEAYNGLIEPRGGLSGDHGNGLYVRCIKE